MSRQAAARLVRGRWLIACGLGEAAGIALVATTYAAIDRGYVAAIPLPILAAGAWEGLCLGCAQALVLRRVGIVPSRWIGLTVAGAVVGYGLSFLGGAGQGSGGGPEPSLAIITLLGAAMGVLMGALMGGLQAFAGHGHLRARRWILASMAGWAPAMAAIMLGAGSVDSSFALGEITLAGAASGAVAGLALGFVTGLALPAGAGRN